MNLNELKSLTVFLGTVGVDQSPTGNWAELAIALVSLCAMEIVLGIDNIVFISITYRLAVLHRDHRVLDQTSLSTRPSLTLISD